MLPQKRKDAELDSLSAAKTQHSVDEKRDY